MNQRPTVYIVVPFHHEQQRFKILKGQRWGAIDHLLLQEIVKFDTSADQLSKSSCLPKRLIIEILIPLMKAGWLELINTDSEYLFRATDRGAAVAKLEQLPLDKEPVISTRQYIIDPSTGDCYRTGHRQQTFQLYSKKRIDDLIQSKDSPIVILEFKTMITEASYSDIFNCVSDRDEEIIAIDDSYIRISRDHTKYALISVDDSDKIGNAPPNISSELCEQIIKSAHKKLELLTAIHQSGKQASTYTLQGKNRSKGYTTHILKEDEYELVLGADKHKSALNEALTEAKTRLIIHSTFINTNNLSSISNSIFTLARRSVKIDILWGQVEPTEEGALKSYQATRECLSNLIEQIYLEGLDTLINIHLEPTESHSKFIIYDKDPEVYIALLGSCNWLNSNFNLFEASVKLSNQNIVAEVVKISSDLARGTSKVSNLFSRELSLLANSLKHDTTDTSHSIAPSASARLVLKNDHYDLVRKARDSAGKDIFICSHQFSHIAKRPIISPIITSTNSNRTIEANIFYSKLCGGLGDDGVKAISNATKELNIKISKISNPVAHAKILTWDDDNAVITSLNWLSASAYGDDLDEIGIHIESPGVAKEIKDEFYKAHLEQKTFSALNPQNI
ncbi:phospholipase D-like domain-containing protein [Pseudomonas sp. KFB-139]|uniref:Phospholipase D-like domain-containing protein n=1 Tax=Pseudomonas serbiensis TaxID=3064350 RepID=A0ABT9CUH0_9PSED|nr:phospholipase D-like domain-containing protein [Pseudomonas sp. KFB-138]MDO7928397.1 phospholipase D-like domain-containing protein [Pseudomonas sp. KFB-138]